MKYERIKFLVIALKNAVEIYAWAPKPYHKFMAFKVCWCCNQNTLCNCKYTRFLYGAEQESDLPAELGSSDTWKSREVGYLLAEGMGCVLIFKG